MPRSILIALVAVLALPAPALARQTVFFDARATHVHGGSARGVVRDAAGRRIGRFSYTCTRGRVERCRARGVTADGLLRLAGPARAGDLVHRWRVAGGTGAYRGARGTAVVRDLDQRESLIAVAIAATGRLRVGVIAHPAADRSFRTRADRICARAVAQLATLPPFPFTDFDPLHPDPALLPQVGAFFTGPGDPRAIFRATLTGLRRLGRPPAAQRAWARVLAGHRAELANIEAQDAAALAGDVAAFVRTVRSHSYRDTAIAATVFGTPTCVY